MAWFKVDDRLYSSLKVMRIPRRLRTAAIGLWTMAGSWSAHDLTDGFIPEFMIEEFGAEIETAEALVETGLWNRVENAKEEGFQFKNWDEYQPTKAEVEERREYEREKKRKQRRDSTGKFAGQAHVPEGQRGDSRGTNRGVPDMSPHGPTVPARPGPSPIESSSGRKRPARPLEPDWEPTETHRAKATEKNINLKLEAEKFRNWAESKDERKANWNAAFTNWIIRASEQQTQTQQTDLWNKKGPF